MPMPSAVNAALPCWLGQARALIHDRYRKNLQLTDIADAVGVHPVHLALVFRSQTEYRSAPTRVNWPPMGRPGGCQNSDDGIAQVALEAGFFNETTSPGRSNGISSASPRWPTAGAARQERRSHPACG